MDLSIIIPCHILEDYLTPLLVSLQLQVYNKKEVEIIFVCDSCSDNTKKVIQEFPWFTTNYSLKLIETNVHNCGLARNEGFNLATGEYIWFLDGDDWLLSPSAINIVFNVLDKNPKEPILRIRFLSSPYFSKNLHTFFSMVWQYIFKKEFINDIKFINIEPSEDVDFMEKVIHKKGDNTYLGLEIPLYYYNFGRPNSNMMKAIANLKKEKYNETYNVNWSEQSSNRLSYLR